MNSFLFQNIQSKKFCLICLKEQSKSTLQRGAKLNLLSNYLNLKRTLKGQLSGFEHIKAMSLNLKLSSYIRLLHIN